MPLPKPAKGEKSSAFISRCMADETARKDFPDQKQRVAVCNSQLRKTRKMEKLAIFLAKVFRG